MIKKLESKILIISKNVGLGKNIENALRGVSGISIVGIVPDVFQAVYQCLILKPDLVLVDIVIAALLGLDIGVMIKKIHLK
jgi:AmiR/NasT family two-component response regulator